MILLSLFLITTFSLSICHPFEDYVNKPEPDYRYEEINRYEENDKTIIMLNQTSLRWMDDTFSDRSVWFHYVAVIIPKTIKIRDTAFLNIVLGNNDQPPPNPDEDTYIYEFAKFSVNTGAVSAVLFNIPNQPINFPGADPEKIEDAIIAQTWRYYMDAPEDKKNPEMILQFPMGKAAIKTMDTITDFCNKENVGLDVQKFFLSGASKRGWTVYMAASVDSRVIGIAPLCIGIGNMIPNLKDHYRSLGGWSIFFYDYWSQNLTERLDDIETKQVAQMVDPYEFISNYTMPTFIVTSSNDEFFMLDSNKFSFDSYPGEHFQWVVRNANHYFTGKFDIVRKNFEGMFLNLVANTEWPRYTTRSEANENSGAIEVVSETPPVRVTGYAALTTPQTSNRRDFRQLISGGTGENDLPVFNDIYFEEVPIQSLPDNRYLLAASKPERGYRGFYIEMEYNGTDGKTFSLSSPPLIVPNTYPVEPCQGRDCKGDVV